MSRRELRHDLGICDLFFEVNLERLGATGLACSEAVIASYSGLPPRWLRHLLPVLKHNMRLS